MYSILVVDGHSLPSLQVPLFANCYNTHQNCAYILDNNISEYVCVWGEDIVVIEMKILKGLVVRYRMWVIFSGMVSIVRKVLVWATLLGYRRHG